MIDAHQHFWKRSRGDYDWLKDEKPILSEHDYLPDDLTAVASPCSVNGSILVQAAETTAESRFILNLAENSEFIRGVVCWLDFDDPLFRDQLDVYQASPKFVGIRPVLQGIPDNDWILAPHRLEVLSELRSRDLTFDALIQPRHLPVLHKLIEQLPELKIVIDHGAKPSIKTGKLEPWGEALASLAQHENLWCKLSGLVTEAPEDWEPSHLHPYMEHLLSAFGPDRLMWGSDWPVVNSASNYGQWLQIARDFVHALQPDSTHKIFHENACRFYSIKTSSAHGEPKV